MFVLNTLRKELARSRRISHNANERSKKLRAEYEELDLKYDFSHANHKLKHLPEVRKNIVTNFLKDLRDTKNHINESDYVDRHRVNIIQKFLSRISGINDNQVRG